MTTISDQELRDDPAAILRRVAAGESFDITDDGVVVAELAPKKDLTELDRPRAAGKVRPATTPRDAVWEIEPIETDMTTQEMIDDLRGPRTAPSARWV